jgi:hypothetical protein
MSGEYLTAQICRNGHVITSVLESHPELSSKYCSDCGEETITKCEFCNETIRGIYITSFTLWHYDLPRNCHSCGKPYIWTQRKLAAAIEYSKEIENLDDSDKEILEQSIIEISNNSPKAEVSVLRYKKILKKVGGKIGDKLYDIVIDLASETLKKLIKE